MLDKKHQYYLTRIYKALNNYSLEYLLAIIYIKDSKNGVDIVEGFSTDDQAVIDPRGQLLPTVIHECLHLCYPSWSEAKVLKTEDTLVKNMTAKQFQNLLIRFCNRV